MLNRKHAKVVTLLGKTSGRDVDKVSELERTHSLEVEEWHGVPLLSGCSAGLLLQRRKGADLIECGDHEVALCDVVDLYRGDTASPLLTTAFLREHGII